MRFGRNQIIHVGYVSQGVELRATLAMRNVRKDNIGSRMVVSLAAVTRVHNCPWSCYVAFVHSYDLDPHGTAHTFGATHRVSTIQL